MFTEYERILKKRLVDGECSTARLPENAERNRFQDVLPYDNARVELVPTKENNTGYINASHIKVRGTARISGTWVLRETRLPELHSCSPAGSTRALNHCQKRFYVPSWGIHTPGLVEGARHQRGRVRLTRPVNHFAPSGGVGARSTRLPNLKLCFPESEDFFSAAPERIHKLRWIFPRDKPTRVLV